MNVLLSALPVFTAVLTLCGVGYSLLALWGLRSFQRSVRAKAGLSTALAMPGVSVLKPLRGDDPRMYAGFVSHCTQVYDGPFELIFGVGDLDDAAVAAVARLQGEYPHIPIQLVACPARLGTNGKVSSLAQMLPHARFEHVLVNDSDILVSPAYLQHVMQPFAAEATPPNSARKPLAGEKPLAAEKPLGLVTVPYFGQASPTAFSRLEALGIATDFIPGVLAARALEGGLRFGLGSTLATTKTALTAIGGFEALADQLADDYELGARLYRAGYRVELVPEVVATSIPAYNWRGFADHQLRWARSTRDSRRTGYLGLLFTYVLPWALCTVVASGGELWSLSLLSLALLVRVAVALGVGVGLLRDAQVLRDLFLLPARDLLGLFFWAWSYAGDTVVWRGERLRLRRGVLEKV